MKRRFLPTVIVAGSMLGLCMAPSEALADNLKVPSSVFRMDRIEEAKAKAAESGEPLVFLYTNPGST